MFNKTKLALAAALVLCSLTAARAEDPDADVEQHFHSAVGQAWAQTSHHAAPFSDLDKRRLSYQK